MSVFNPIAPTGFYVLIDPDQGILAGDCNGNLTRIEKDRRTTRCYYGWGWSDLLRNCAPRNNSWVGRYRRFETIEDARQAFPQYVDGWPDP